MIGQRVENVLQFKRVGSARFVVEIPRYVYKCHQFMRIPIKGGLGDPLESLKMTLIPKDHYCVSVYVPLNNSHLLAFNMQYKSQKSQTNLPVNRPPFNRCFAHTNSLPVRDTRRHLSESSGRRQGEGMCRQKANFL